MIALSQAIQCVDDEDRLTDAHWNGEPEIVANLIDDGLRAAIRIAEDEAPWDVCLCREHRRKPYSSTSVRNCMGRRDTKASEPTCSRYFAVRDGYSSTLAQGRFQLFLSFIGKRRFQHPRLVRLDFRQHPVDRVLPEIEPYKPRVLKTSLSNEAEEKLKAALSKGA